MIEKYNLNHCDLVLSCNHDTLDIVRRKGYKNKIGILPFGIEKKWISKFDINKTKEKFTIAFVGRITKEKGIVTLVKAFNDLENPVILSVFGDGNYKSYIKTNLINKHKIIFNSYIDHNQFDRIYKGLNLLVLPSITKNTWKEQFGRVLIEAMTFGVPVIGSDSGEIPKVIGDAGLIFREEDSKGLKKCIFQIVNNNKLREELSKKGLERVRNNYTIEGITEILKDQLLYLV